MTPNPNLIRECWEEFLACIQQAGNLEPHYVMAQKIAYYTGIFDAVAALQEMASHGDPEMMLEQQALMRNEYDAHMGEVELFAQDHQTGLSEEIRNKINGLALPPGN